MEYVRKGGKQVMKKKIAVVLTALMVMAMGTTWRACRVVHKACKMLGM